MLKCETVGGVAVLVAEVRELDADSSPAFRHQAEQALAGHRNAVLDLGELEFVDSTGIGAILACARLLEAAEGTLRLCAVKPPVRATLAAVRLDRLVPSHATRPEALASFETR